MPYGAHIISLVEDALAEAFQYHNGLDSFVLRAGVSHARLKASRERAEERSKRFARAPKRFVVQELLVDLGDGGSENDRLLAALVTALCNGRFSEATARATAAIDALKELRLVERDEAERRRCEQRTRERDEERLRERAEAERAAMRERFKGSFLGLSQQSNSQARGYALEKFLNEFFAYEGLKPRGSFKLIGEQIDGSFTWAGRIYLVEAKWASAPVNGAGFSSLMYKIEGKTADTRGLFIAINGYSPEAIEGLRRKGELRFVCLDGAHLMRCLGQGMTLPLLLETVWRHAGETGEAYLPVSSFLRAD